jgi:predicted nucleic acid-binding protein
MVIVDTSVLIDFLRGTSLPAFEALVLEGKILLSKVVKLELLAGTKKSETSGLMTLLDGLIELPNFAAAITCEKLLHRARGRGLFGGLPDLMILADVVEQKGLLYTHDAKQSRLAEEIKLSLFCDTALKS